MNIVFVLNEPYPIGMACTKRVHLYAKGLFELGEDVSIVIPRAKEKRQPKNKNILKGTYQGIKFYHTAGNILRSKNILKRKWFDFYGPIKAFLLIRRINPDKVILIGSRIYHILLFKILTKSIGAEYIREKSEVPYFNKEKIGFLKILKTKLLFSLFDGIIAISDELANFFRNEIKVKAKIIVVPIIKESGRIINEAGNPGISHSILYTGSLLERKDGVMSIIKAIAEARRTYKDIKLIITGDAVSSPDYIKVSKLIEELSIGDNIFFTGFITSDELEKLTFESAIHISIKPNNRQNRYNFPTKLGEYLSSGVPVLSTKTKAISKFLTDREHIFFTTHNYTNILESIIYIFEHQDLAMQVGRAGKELADKYFDYRYQSKRLKNFLNNESR